MEDVFIGLVALGLGIWAGRTAFLKWRKLWIGWVAGIAIYLAVGTPLYMAYDSTPEGRLDHALDEDRFFNEQPDPY